MGTNKFQETIKACSSCLMCRHACTVGNVTLRDTNLPRGKAMLLLALQKDLLDWDKRAVEVVYQCTNCHLCREWCPPGWDIAPLMIAARAEVVDARLAPLKALEIKQKYEGFGNPYGEARTQLAVGSTIPCRSVSSETSAGEELESLLRTRIFRVIMAKVNIVRSSIVRVYLINH